MGTVSGPAGYICMCVSNGEPKQFLPIKKLDMDKNPTWHKHSYDLGMVNSPLPGWFAKG